MFVYESERGAMDSDYSSENESEVEEELYAVERIVNKKETDKGVKYLVKWKGYR